MTTQYLEEADRLAQSIVVIDKGHVIAKGTPAELKAELGATVLELTLASEEAAQQTAALLATLSTKTPHIDGVTVGLTVDEGPKIAAEALRRMDADGIDMLGLALHEPSLDDVFLALTGRKAEVDTEALVEGTTRKGRKAKEAS